MQFLSGSRYEPKMQEANAQPEFNFDLDRMRTAVAGGSIRIPSGLSREQRRKWIFENAGKCSD